MANDADKASQYEEAQLRHSLKVRRDVPKPMGHCLSCGEELRGNQCFCDNDCRDDYNRAKSARERNGKC